MVENPVVNAVNDELLIMANNVRRDYNKTREDCRRLYNRYYNQSIASSYISEDELVEHIEKCRQLKQQYADICIILKSHGINPPHATLHVL